MRAALVIAWKELRQRFRDRSAIILTFVGPVVLGFIVGNAVGSGFINSFDATYAVVNNDADGPVAATFVDQVLPAIEVGGQLTVTDAASVEDARARIEADEISAAFVIEEGFSASVINNAAAEIAVLRNPNANIGSQIAMAIAGAFTDQINAGRLSVQTAAQTGVQTPLIQLVNEAVAERIPVEIVEGEIGVREVSGATYFGPAMAIFFLFFTTGFAARSLLSERTDGTLPRVLAAPIRRSQLVGGKAIAGFVFGMSSLAVMFVIFGIAFDVSWGDPVAVVAVSVVTVLALMALMSVVMVLTKTQEQADAYSSAIATSFALIGGNFFPVFQMPQALQVASYATPNGWALRAYSEIAYDGAGVTGIGLHLAVIGAFALVVGSFAFWRAGRLE